MKLDRSWRSTVAVVFLFLFVFSFAGPAESAAKKRPRSRSTTSQKKRTTPARRRSAPRRVAPAPAAPALSGTLEQRLATLLNSGVAVNSTASVQIVEVDTGRVVAERNPHLPVAPASNMKLFTTAAALDLLKPQFDFRTTVSMRGSVDGTGTLHGDVKITGRGDPTIGGRFHDGNAAAVLDEWASELKRAGVKTVTGDLIFEYGYMDTEYVHPSWPSNQLVNWYEAPISALSMQEGTVMVRVLPGRPGGLATVQLEPPNDYVTVQNSCTTGGGRGVFITRLPGTNTVVVRGSVPARSGATEVYVTILNPVHYFGSVTHDTFERDGVHIVGRAILTPSDPRPDWRVVTETRTPLPDVIYVINKKSQNQYAEQLVKTIGAEAKKNGSWEGGTAAVSEWLTGKLGVPREEFTQIDGSGMSRFNRTSSNAFIHMLRYMWASPYRREFVSSMPYTGEHDSRLKRRLNRPPFARQVYAKTGYISGVVGLSGYVHAQSGKIYAFSFLFNQYRTGVWAVYNLHDAMLKEIVQHG